MSTDEILWKNIEALQRERSQPFGGQRPQTARRSPAGQRASLPPEGGRDDKPARQQATKLESNPPLPQASTPARSHASTHASQVEAIRKVVKVLGKEVAFVRLTPAEKHRLADVVFAYKRQGVRTSENELLRIALNLLLDDYREHGQASVLAQVLAALNA